MNYSFSTARKSTRSGCPAPKGRARNNRTAGRFKGRVFIRSLPPDIYSVSWITVSCSVLLPAIPKQNDLL